MTLEEAQSRGHLEVDVSQPAAGDQVRAWRALCRRRQQPCLVVALEGEAASIELRPAPGMDFLEFGASEFCAHPVLGNHTGGVSSYGSQELRLNSYCQQDLEAVLSALRQVITSHLSQERREASLRPRPLAPAFHPAMPTWEVPEKGPLPPELLLRVCLEAREYAVLSRLLDLCEKRPRAVYSRAHTPDPRLPDGHSLASVLQACFQLPPGLLESWQENCGPYSWEDRFDTPVTLTEDHAICLSRPGFDKAGQHALAHILSYDDELAAFVLLRLEAEGWSVVEISHDQDREPAHFETERGWGERCQPEGRVSPLWKQAGPGYGAAASQAWLSWQEVREVQGSYQELVQAHGGPTQLLERELIPVLHGPPLSLRHLLMLAQDRGEILYDLEPSPLSRSLRSQGLSVIRWDAGGPDWLGPLLAHLSERFPCHHAPEVWECPEVVAVEAELVDLLERLLGMAGLPHFVSAARFQGESSFLIQEAPGRPVRLARGDLSQPGRLLIREQTLLQVRRDRGSLYRLVSSLLRWGDPTGRWTSSVWHATGVVSYDL